MHLWVSWGFFMCPGPCFQFLLFPISYLKFVGVFFTRPINDNRPITLLNGTFPIQLLQPLQLLLKKLLIWVIFTNRFQHSFGDFELTLLNYEKLWTSLILVGYDRTSMHIDFLSSRQKFDQHWSRPLAKESCRPEPFDQNISILVFHKQ